MSSFPLPPADANEIMDGARSSINLQVIVEKFGDLAVGVALLSERGNNLTVRLQLGAVWVIGEAVQQVADFRVHIIFASVCAAIAHNRNNPNSIRFDSVLFGNFRYLLRPSARRPGSKQHPTEQTAAKIGSGT